MSNLLLALKAGIQAFKMVYKGWCVEEYKKYDKNNYYIDATIWYDNGNFNMWLHDKVKTGWNVSRKGRTYTELYKTPYEAIIFAEKLIEKENVD